MSGEFSMDMPGNTPHEPPTAPGTQVPANAYIPGISQEQVTRSDHDPEDDTRDEPMYWGYVRLFTGAKVWIRVGAVPESLARQWILNGWMTPAGATDKPGPKE